MERTTHPITPEEVMAYLDGELSPERATAAAAHLEHCNECRAVVADLRGVSRQLAAWQVETAPEGFTESAIRSAAAPAQKYPEMEPAKSLEKRPVRSFLPQGFLWWGGAFAAAALLLLVVGVPSLYRAKAPAPNYPKTAAVSDLRQSTTVAGNTAAPRPPMTADRATADRTMASHPASESKMKDLDANVIRDIPASRAEAARRHAGASANLSANGPMIIRRATLALLTKEFDSARAAMENLVKTHQGYFGQLDVATPANSGRSLTATVRVPAAQLDPVLIELRKLGRVEQENQSADDVTGQYVDLTARLSNARETEKRLVEILRERTGRVSDVLEVEEQISNTRQQIEQMDAQRKTMENQIQFASVELRISEEYKQSLDTPVPSLGTRIHNAAVDGYLGAADLVIGLFLFLLNAGPTLLLLAAMLAWPVLRVSRWVLRRYGLARASSQTV